MTGSAISFLGTAAHNLYSHLQVQYNSEGTTYIDVEVLRPSVAFFLVHNLKKEGLLDCDDVVQSCGAWQAVAAAFSTSEEYFQIMTDKASLLETINVSSSELMPKGSSWMSDGLTEAAVRSARSALRPLLVLLRLIQNPPSSPPAQAQKHPLQSESHKAVAAPRISSKNQLAGGSPLQTPPLSSEALSDQQQSEPDSTVAPAAHGCSISAADAAGQSIKLMRTLLLVFKLACLTRIEAGNEAADATRTVFWRMLNQLGFSICAVELRTGVDTGTETDLQTESSEQFGDIQFLCDTLVQLVMPSLRQSVQNLNNFPNIAVAAEEHPKLSGCLAEVVVCFQTLQSMFAPRNPQIRLATCNGMLKSGRLATSGCGTCM